MTTPIKVTKVDKTFNNSNLSLKQKTPATNAKTILVSRKAITRGIGALVKAHITIQYARKDAAPPRRKTLLPFFATLN